MSGGVVCGFWDEAALLAGLGWALGGSGGGLLLHGDAATPASPEIGGDDVVRLELAADDETVEAELTPLGGARPLAGVFNGNGTESAPCTATVRVAGERRVTECVGQVTRWATDPLEGAGILRHLAMPAADESLLVVLARGDAGTGWGAESSSAWLLDGEGSVTAYPDAWLSTEYDPDGNQTRAGLELWSEDRDAPPLRAAGTLLGDPTRASGGISAAIMRTSAEGAGGLGTYLIWRG